MSLPGSQSGDETWLQILSLIGLSDSRVKYRLCTVRLTPPGGLGHVRIAQN